MNGKLLVCINDIKDISKLTELEVNNFVMCLKDFSIGHNSFDLEVINKYDTYILINRILDCNDVDELKKILKSVSDNVRGIIFDDAAVLEIVKELNLDLELIWMQNHFGTNTEMIDFWLNQGVDSCFISNELTEEEIKYILDNSSNPLCVQIFGYNHAMYSRRTLIRNYTDFYSLESTNELDLKTDSDIGFKVVEEGKGTVFLSDKVFDGTGLRFLDNVKYYYIDMSLIDSEKIYELIRTFDVKTLDLEVDSGFLDKETIYKLPEVKS